MPIINSVVFSNGGGLPSTQTQSNFTGATVPLTYKDNAISYENNYEYKSLTHNITITGLNGRATITGNGTQNVTVAFNVTSATSSLKNFDITCVNGSQSITYKGLHAHYGTTLTTTQVLVFYYLNVTKDGTEGTINSSYAFYVSTTQPTFTFATSVYATSIYPYQILNILLGRATTLSNTLLSFCTSFNQPLTIPSSVTATPGSFLNTAFNFNQPITFHSGVTTINASFLLNARAFNQPLNLPSGVTTIGAAFLRGTNSFNQPLTIPSGVTTITNNFLHGALSFNQPLTIPSGVTSIGNSFLREAQAFNQPFIIPSSVTTIGTEFLHGGTDAQIPFSSFNQPLTIPSTVTSIGTTFLFNCGALSTIIYEATPIPTDNGSLSQNFNTKTSALGTGIFVYGSRRTAVLTALPDRTTAPFRKLIDGGS